jgi:hypothetical protein
MRRLFADRLVIATGITVFLMSALFALLRVAPDRCLSRSQQLRQLHHIGRDLIFW